MYVRTFTDNSRKKKYVCGGWGPDHAAGLSLEALPDPAPEAELRDERGVEQGLRSQTLDAA